MADARISPEVFAQQIEVILQVAARYRDDPDFRATLSGDAREVLTGMGLTLPAGVEVRVHVNTADTLYLAMPPDPNVELADEALVAVAGGGATASSMGTASSFSTLVVSTASTLSCASTLNTDAL